MKSRSSRIRSSVKPRCQISRLRPSIEPSACEYSAFNKLNGVLNCYIVGGCEQKMNVFWHDDERMQLKTSFSPISVQSFQEKARVVLDDKQTTPLPC